jgi:hypothetical protein
VLRIEEPFFMDGDGKRFVSPGTLSPDHLRIRQLAEAAQAEEATVLFGGHTHQVTITEGECRWDLEPKRGTLGCVDLLPRLPSPGDTIANVECPRDQIVSEMKRLKDEHFRRVRIGAARRGRHPKTLKGFEGNRTKSRPDWQPDPRFYQLIAIGNEAERAGANDVSEDDVVFYTSHVDDLVRSLPPPL